MLTELMVILEVKFTTLYPLSTLTASYFESESLEEELEILFHNLCICHYNDYDDGDDVYLTQAWRPCC